MSVHVRPRAPRARRLSRLAGAAGLTLLLAGLLPVPAAVAAPLRPATVAALSAPRADLAGALAPDGTFRGGAGVAGAVDMGAWRLASNMAAGEAPRFVRTGSGATATPAAISGPWAPLGSDGSGDGALNGKVNAIAVSGSDVYVGGAFTTVAGIPGANFIARWNGSTWSTVGPAYSLGDQVEALAVSGSTVYAAGRFTDAGGVATADYVAKWNGTTWSALGSDGAGDGALNNWVHAIAVSGADVYVGGIFTDAAGIAAADYVAKWNGSSWAALGSNGAGDGAIGPTTNSPSVSVFALAISGSDLYVGGVFLDVAGDPLADTIVKWNGSAWSALNGGTQGPDGGVISGGVYAIAISGTDVYVGGSFQDANATSADNVAKWNGTVWSALGSAPNSLDGAITGNVHALAVSGTDLYVGGEFMDAAGLPTGDRIARWDGSTWSAMGSGGPDGGALNDEVNALSVSGGSVLYVGGSFFDAAGIPTADFMAQWGPRVAAIRRPDARIQVGTAAAAGDNVYNTTGSGQTATGAATRGHTVSYVINVQNDGPGYDAFTIKATGTALRTFTVRYYRGSTDITAAVVAGTYRTPLLAPGPLFAITAKVSVGTTAGVGTSVTRLVTVSSVADSARKDAVKLIARRV